MKHFIHWKLALLRDKNIPGFMVRIIDWVRYELLD